MSRNSLLVALGSIWTFYSVFHITEMVVGTSELWSLATPLGLGVLLSASYWWACGVVDVPSLRSTANALHLSVPLLWAAWVISMHQAVLTPNQAGLLAFNMALGAALADLGSFGELQVARRRAMFLGQTESYTFRPLSAYESGRFSSPQLSACDSGGFPRP